MGRQPVKNNLIMTLEVIKRHSDVDHRLTQKNIQEYLQTDFELTCDRKTVKRNLMNLIEFGFDIEYTEIWNYSDEEPVKYEMKCFFTKFSIMP